MLGDDVIFIKNRMSDAGALVLGWICLLLASFAFSKSLMNFPIYLPLFLASLVLAIMAIREGRIFGGLFLFLATLWIPLHLVNNQYQSEIKGIEQTYLNKGEQGKPLPQATKSHIPDRQQVIDPAVIENIYATPIASLKAEEIELGFSVLIDNNVSTRNTIKLTQDHLIYITDDKIIGKNLKTLEEAFSIPLQGRISGYAIEKGGNRLVYCDAQDTLHIVDLATQIDIPLPTPNPLFSKADISWDNPNEITFSQAKENSYTLNLDTLVLAKKQKSKSQQAKEHPHCDIYGGDITNSGKGFGEYLLLGNKGHSYTKAILPLPNLKHREAYTTSPDLRHLATLSRSGELHLHYLKQADEPDQRYFSFHYDTDQLDDIRKLALGKLIVGKRELIGEVYAPLVNPLNQKTIGPDLNNFRGLAKVTHWKNNKVTVLVTKAVKEVRDGDVLTALTHPKGEGNFLRDKWFILQTSPPDKSSPDSNIKFGNSLIQQGRDGIGGKAQQRIKEALDREDWAEATEYAKYALELDPANTDIKRTKKVNYILTTKGALALRS